MKGKCKSCTMSEIAAKLGISKTAVSLALRNSTRISPKTKSKVRMQAKRMGYAVSPLVSTLMSNMRTSKARDNLETIVLINANRERNILQKYPIFSKYAEGVKSEAAMLGYSVYEVWLYEPGMSAEKLMRVMHSRGIRGGVELYIRICGHKNQQSGSGFCICRQISYCAPRYFGGYTLGVQASGSDTRQGHRQSRGGKVYRRLFMRTNEFGRVRQNTAHAQCEKSDIKVGLF